MTRLRVVCLAPLPPPATGQSVVTRAALDALATAFDVEAVDTADRTHVWRRAGTLPFARVGVWVRRLATFRRLVRDRPDAVYLTPASSTLGLLRDAAALALVPRGVRVVAHVHVGDYGLLLASPRTGALARSTAGRAACILVPSAYAAAGIRAAMPGAPVEVVPNPAPTDVLSDDVAAARAALPPRDRPHVLFLSNTIPSKGYTMLAEAAHRLRAAGTAFQLTFAGPWPDAASRAHFKAHLARLGLTERVSVIGAVPRGDLRALLLGTDVLAFPSRYPHESLPVAVIEAMAAGCAVAAIDHAGVAELVRDGVDGCLAPRLTGDAEQAAAFADALARTLAGAAAFGAAAAARAAAAFSPEVFAEAIRAAVLSCPPAPR